MVTEESCLPLVLISNHLDLIRVADDCRIARIMIDLETIGKEKRQKGKNLFISDHRMNDINVTKKILTHAQCMVRINPPGSQTKEEISQVINCGADIIMLPFFTNGSQVEEFVDRISGRATVSLLLETKQALENIQEIVSIPGVDEIHIGLNDLSLSLGTSNIFDVIVDGTLERLRQIIVDKGIRFGFGGAAPPSIDLYPIHPHLVIAEQMRLESNLALLSRRVSTPLENKENAGRLENIISEIETYAQQCKHADENAQLNHRQQFIVEINLMKQAAV